MVTLPRKNLHVEHLSIGECIFTSRGMFISTVLGSCVAVCFYHKNTGTAAMFHAILPDAGYSRQCSNPCGFVDLAVNSIMARFKGSRIYADALEVKLFGGANTIAQGEGDELRDILDVGKKNVETARRVLADYGLQPRNECVLGMNGRKIVMDTTTGEVWVKFLANTGPLSEDFCQR